MTWSTGRRLLPLTVLAILASVLRAQSSEPEVVGNTTEAQLSALAAVTWESAWRVKASGLASGWAWDVNRVRFLTPHGEVTPSSPGCVVLESGHVDVAGYEPERAFEEGGWWGGRADGAGDFYIGLRCQSNVEVIEVALEQSTSHFASSARLEQLSARGWAPVATVGLQRGVLQTLWSFPTSWRVLARSSVDGWAWDVRRLKFLTSSGEVHLGGPEGCTAIESGHVDVAGYGPERAFQGVGLWGGRKAVPSGDFFIGLQCPRWVPVDSVQLEQGEGHQAEEIEVQKWTRTGWSTVSQRHLRGSTLQTVWPQPSQWRLLARSPKWAWDVKRLKFRTAEGELALGRDRRAPGGGCWAIESGHVDVAGYGPENAFRDAGLWGGRKDRAGDSFIGLRCNQPGQLLSVQLLQGTGHFVESVEVQSLGVSGWSTIATAQATHTGALQTLWLLHPMV